MSNVKHKIWFGFNSEIDIDGDPDTVELFRILGQDGQYLLGQDGNYLTSQDGI